MIRTKSPFLNLLLISEMGREPPPRIQPGNDRFQDIFPVPTALLNGRFSTQLGHLVLPYIRERCISIPAQSLSLGTLRICVHDSMLKKGGFGLTDPVMIRTAYSAIQIFRIPLFRPVREPGSLNGRISEFQVFTPLGISVHTAPPTVMR